jgi:hypothetical protein
MPDASNNTMFVSRNVICVQGVARKYVACPSRFSSSEKGLGFTLQISGSMSLLARLLEALLVTTALEAYGLSH